MCGLCGEVRFDGRAADVSAVQRMSESLAPRGPDGEGVWAQGRVAFGHRRLSIIDLSACGAQPMQDPELGLTAVFNGCVYNYPQLREELDRARLPLHLDLSDTEVIVKGYHRWGVDVVDHLHRHVRRRRPRAGLRPGGPHARPARHQAAVPGRDPGPAAVRLLAARAAGRGRRRHLDRPRRPAPLPVLARRRARAAHRSCSGVRKLPPATVRVVEADGEQPRAPLLGARPRPRERARRLVRARLGGRGPGRRCAPRCGGGLVADVPVGVLLSGGLDSSLIVALLAEAGPDRAGDLLHRLRVRRRPRGRRVRVLRRHRRALRRPTTTASGSAGDELVGALGHAIGAMSEPMVSHDVVAFDLLSQQVSQTIKVVQSGQGADEVFGGYHWYPPLAGLTPRAGRSTPTRRPFFDRDHAGMARVAGPALAHPDRRLARVRRRALRRARRGHRRRRRAAPGHRGHAGRRPGEAGGQHDDGLGPGGAGARSSTTTSSSSPPRSRRSCKLADGGKGDPQAVGRYRVIPREVIDRPKGYFPVPAITHLRGRGARTWCGTR